MWRWPAIEVSFSGDKFLSTRWLHPWLARIAENLGKPSEPGCVQRDGDVTNRWSCLMEMYIFVLQKAPQPLRAGSHSYLWKIQTGQQLDLNLLVGTWKPYLCLAQPSSKRCPHSSIFPPTCSQSVGGGKGAVVGRSGDKDTPAQGKVLPAVCAGHPCAVTCCSGMSPDSRQPWTHQLCNLLGDHHELDIATLGIWLMPTEQRRQQGLAASLRVKTSLCKLFHPNVTSEEGLQE